MNISTLIPSPMNSLQFKQKKIIFYIIITSNFAIILKQQLRRTLQKIYILHNFNQLENVPQQTPVYNANEWATAVSNLYDYYSTTIITFHLAQITLCTKCTQCQVNDQTFISLWLSVRNPISVLQSECVIISIHYLRDLKI